MQPDLPTPPLAPDKAPVIALSRNELLWIAHEVGLLKLFGERRVRSITLDYVPARAAIILPRLPGDDPITPMPPHVEEITYNLEDTMFGGEVYTSVTARGFVIVNPFRWVSWESLAASTIIIT